VANFAVPLPVCIGTALFFESSAVWDTMQPPVGSVAMTVPPDQPDQETAPDNIQLTAPRQPGSALKPFLYARALDKGWTAATMINDSPLAEAVGNGLHRFHDYDQEYHGEIPLREALGNSLNIPAVLAAQYVGVGDYLATLRRLGFQSLGRSAEIYGDGLALGNGEVTLFELVQGYAALAIRWIYPRVSLKLWLRGLFGEMSTLAGNRFGQSPKRKK
jgi:membrane carboxypeptidase/penicillin-binding protein PbpC